MPVWVGSSQRGLVVFEFSLVRQGRQGRRVRRAVRVRRVREGREESKPGMGWAGSARRKTHVVCPLRAPFLAFLVHRVVAFVHPIPTLPEPPIQRNAALTNQLPLALLPTIPTHTGRARLWGCSCIAHRLAESPKRVGRAEQRRLRSFLPEPIPSRHHAQPHRRCVRRRWVVRKQAGSAVVCACLSSNPLLLRPYSACVCVG